MQALRDENVRLRAALEETRTTSPSFNKEAVAVPVSDLDFTIAELWSQRFEDNQFRARQRLDQKQLRVTGLVESVSERSVTLFGTGTRFGSVSVFVQLEEAYIKQIAEGLGSLKKGASVTVQGQFLFDKMWLEGAFFVDRETGKRLASKEVTDLSGLQKEDSQNAPAPGEVGKNE